MHLSKTARAGLAAAALTAGVLTATGPGFAVAAVETAKDVIVRNPDSAPVPMKAIGTTKVDASGQTLTINGVVDASKAPITIRGDASRPVPVTVVGTPAEAPLQTTARIAYATTERIGVTTIEVPEGETWTIERVGYGSAEPEQDAVGLTLTDGATGTQVRVPLGQGQAAVDHLTKLYARDRLVIALKLAEGARSDLLLPIQLTGTMRAATP